MKKSTGQIEKSSSTARKNSFTTSYEVHNKESLSKSDSRLLELAFEALDDSYSPYSNFKVGASLLLDNGEMIKGANQENASYPLCLCAERVALAAASAVHPGCKVMTLAVTAKSSKMAMTSPVSPCGACRQVIREVEIMHDQDIRIILSGESGDIYIFENAKELLPLSFDPSVL